MIGDVKIDRRTLIAGAGVAALTPVAAQAYAPSEGMADDVIAALARFRSSNPAISTAIMSRTPLFRSSSRAFIRANVRCSL
jgi:hypothetical protein